MKLALHKKIALGVLCAVMLIFTAFSPAPHPVAYAANTDIKFDETNVLDDLKSSTIDGQPFNLADYPYSTDLFPIAPRIISIVEYCYSYKINMQANYGLYVYFYNPQSLEIDTTNHGNKIQMAVSYGLNAEGIIVPTDYEKFDLQFCNMSTDPDYYGLFYKFKVVDHIAQINGKTIRERISKDIKNQQADGVTINECVRRYDVSGVELTERGKPNAQDYFVAQTFRYKGFAKGYGANPNADSTLDCKIKELTTTELTVQHTFYRTESSSIGKNYQNELNTAYFAVDNVLIEEFGKLQKIKAEWWEYKTKPIVVATNQSVVESMQDYIAVDIGAYDTAVPYGFTSNDYRMQGDMAIYNWCYNGYWGSGSNKGVTVAENRDSILYYILYSADKITNVQLATYIRNYDKSFANGRLPIKENSISADLFADSVEVGRTRGYNCVNVDAGDTYDLLSYNSTHNFWDKVGDYGFWATIFNKVPSDEPVPIKPIYDVKDSDLQVSDKTLSKSLLIDESDINDFRKYCETETKKTDEYPKGKTVFLFRFAATDYFAQSLTIKNGSKVIDGSAYRAQETVFLDFDILELTFYKDGFYTVIPVVSSPIDIINPITPPPDFSKNSWLKWLLIAIALILLLVLLSPLLPHILNFILWLVKGIWAIITFPFRAIGKAVKTRKQKAIKKE